MVNNSPVDYFNIDSPVQTQYSKLLEEEKARQFCNIDIETFNAMVGGRRYAHLSPYKFGAIVCKADAIVVYRLLQKSQGVAESLSIKSKRR